MACGVPRFGALGQAKAPLGSGSEGLRQWQDVVRGAGDITVVTEKLALVSCH